MQCLDFNMIKKINIDKEPMNDKWLRGDIEKIRKYVEMKEKSN